MTWDRVGETDMSLNAVCGRTLPHSLGQRQTLFPALLIGLLASENAGQPLPGPPICVEESVVYPK